MRASLWARRKSVRGRGSLPTQEGRLDIPLRWFLTVFLVVAVVWVVDFSLLLMERISPEVFTIFEFTAGIDGVIVIAALSILRLRKVSRSKGTAK